MGLTRSVALFLILRFAGGAASALALILASAMVLEVLAEANRAELSSLLFVGVGMGIVVSAALVSALRADDFTWPALWFASGALSLAGAIAVAVLTPECGGARPAYLRGPASPPNPAFLRLVAAYGLFGFGYVITATFLVAMVRGNPTVLPLEPLIWVMFGLAAVPSVAVWTRLAGPLGLPGAFALACLVEAAGVLLSVAWPSTAGLFLDAILVGGTFMGLTALGLVRARHLGTGDGHCAIALMTSAFGLGQIVGPSFAGTLYNRFGSLGVPLVAAATALALAALLARG